MGTWRCYTNGRRNPLFLGEDKELRILFATRSIKLSDCDRQDSRHVHENGTRCVFMSFKLS